MKAITVFTQTYNRGKCLEKLYNSLIDQTCKNFEWIIIDDGSSDNTKEIVASFLDNPYFPVRYYYQENGGKHRAFNSAVSKSECELFMCVDSDDWLTNDAIEVIVNSWKNESDNHLAGILAYRGIDADHTMSGEQFIESKQYATVTEEMKRGFFETTMVQRLDILKKFPFPEIEKENFITEDIVWKQIDQNYYYKIIPKVLTICFYRDDGLTKNVNMFTCPKGWKKYFLILYKCSNGAFDKLVNYSKYLAYDEGYDEYNNIFLNILCYVPSRVIRLHWNKRENK